ncbi:MAG: TonB-dependent receptor [Bacteroidota bacterium]
MLETLRSIFLKFVLSGFFFLQSILPLHAQEAKTERLISYLTQLEHRFDIKFSYVDEDVKNVMISFPQPSTLKEKLLAIETLTQLKIKKLNDRYYTIVKSALVDICGRVLDNFAKNNVPGATVEVLGSEIAVITDANGNFSLPGIPRGTSLKIRYLGYTTKYMDVDNFIEQGGCPKILLAQNYERLDEVVIYEFLTSGISKQEDASITLNTNELGILPGLIEPDVLQTVQSLPGIKSIDETVSDINVRGGTNDQNLILWNGIKMYQSGHFFGLISAFNPYLTDKVTIYKNGTPGQYGDGVSSVISMETKNTIDNYYWGGAGFNFISGDVYGQIPINDKLAFQFSARRSTTDFLNTPAYNSFTDRAFQDTEIRNQQNQSIEEEFQRDEKFFFYDFTAKVLYKINDLHELRLNFIGIDNDLDFSETSIAANETTRSFLDQTNVSLGLQFQSNWTNRFSSHVNVYYSNYDLDAQSISALQEQQLFQQNSVDERALKVNTIFKVNESLQLDNGYQYIETGITNTAFVTQPPFDSNSKGVIRIHAPYSELAYTSNKEKFIARGGLRVNYIENLNTFNTILWEPRININFRLANYLRGEFLGEFKSQTTNQVIDLEQNFLGIEKRRWILSDDNTLPITESKQGSFGLNYAKNSLYIGIEGFYKHVDGISTRTQGFQNENQFDGEIGSYEIRGLEFLINKKGVNYSTWLSYTYNKNDYTFGEIDPNTFPNNLDVRHTLTFASSYNLKHLKLSFGINYRTGKPFTAPQLGDQALNTTVFPAQINYQPPNSDRLPEYFRFDMSATYDFDIGQRIRASSGLSLLNLTNRKNILNRYYRVADDNSSIETVENISLGITPNVSFRIRF